MAEINDMFADDEGRAAVGSSVRSSQDGVQQVTVAAQLPAQPEEVPGGKRVQAEGAAAMPEPKRIKLLPKQKPATGPERRPVCQTAILLAAAEDRGSRQEMEDVCVLLEDARCDMSSPHRVAFAALFDGHGGKNVALRASQCLHQAALDAGLCNAMAAQGGAGASQVDTKAARKAILTAFKETDRAVLADAKQHSWSDGAVCAAVWVLRQTVLVANIGDTACVLARDEGPEGPGQGLRAITLTREHKALFLAERARIEKAGGSVTRDGRLQGKVEVSRAFGDAPFKGRGMVATPDIQAFTISPQDRFLLLGCDGFMGVFGSDDAVRTADQLLKEGRTPKAACNRLIYQAVRERRCKDNCSVLMLKLVQQDVP